MGKFALIVRLGSNDNESVVEGEQFLMTGILNLLNRRDATEIKFDKLFSQLKKLRLEPNERSMDLLIIACAMYTADTRIERQGSSDDSWTRAIKLFIPVAEYDFWLTQQQRLIEIFRFLTGDLWEIKFRPRASQDAIAPRGRRRNYGMSYSTNVVSLFSGGMDSFIGAIDLLSSGVQPLLLGHAKSADVSPYQRKCEDALHQAFSQVTFQRLYSFIRVPKNVVYPSEEKSERGRSFLFLTLGGIVAACLSDHSVLIVPENGLISLNLPLTPLRVGSHSTRTTHPHYMAMMQELFRNMALGVTLNNPYQFKTKGEMLLECADHRLVETTSTMSCSHPAPKRGDGVKHCGYCVPCLIRKAAFLRAGLLDRMEYRVNIGDRSELDTTAKIDNILAFNYMIKKVQNNPSYLDSVIRMTGPLGPEVSSYKETFDRGLREVSQLLNTVNL